MTAPTNPDDRDDRGCHELLMPFLSVASRGGPHEDDSYVAGWEMGALDAELRLGRPPAVDRVIHTANRDQADLIAMRHGYTARVTPSNTDEWSFLRLEMCGAAP